MSKILSNMMSDLEALERNLEQKQPKLNYETDIIQQNRILKTTILSIDQEKKHLLDKMLNLQTENDAIRSQITNSSFQNSLTVKQMELQNENLKCELLNAKERICSLEEKLSSLNEIMILQNELTNEIQQLQQQKQHDDDIIAKFQIKDTQQREQIGQLTRVIQQQAEAMK